MQKGIVVTVNDYERLMGLIEFASLRVKAPQIVDRLQKTLSDAKMLPQTNIDRKIITMNSRVKVKDTKSGREAEITITYPDFADARERRVSVFSEIGLALLGRQEKDVVSWKVPGAGRYRDGVFEVITVTYQPEAAGDFYL
jgi:regulator of nucleoside diphosphate kinase